MFVKSSNYTIGVVLTKDIYWNQMWSEVGLFPLRLAYTALLRSDRRALASESQFPVNRLVRSSPVSPVLQGCCTLNLDRFDSRWVILRIAAYRISIWNLEVDFYGQLNDKIERDLDATTTIRLIGNGEGDINIFGPTWFIGDDDPVTWHACIYGLMITSLSTGKLWAWPICVAMPQCCAPLLFSNQHTRRSPSLQL